MAWWVAWWVGKKLNDLARGHQRKDEKRAELLKAIRYLERLNDEISDLLGQLPSEIQAFRETRTGFEIRGASPYWDILQPSGELPRLLDPQLLGALTQFYDCLIYAKQQSDLVTKSLLNTGLINNYPGMKEELDNRALSVLEAVLNLGEELPDKLASEIQVLSDQL